MVYAIRLTDGTPLQDFAAYHRGARGVLERSDPYDPRNPGSLLPFIYPPFAALVLAPLGLLEQRWAAVVFTLTSTTALYLVCRTAIVSLWGPAGRASSWWYAAAISVVVMITEPVWATLGLGQINLALMALVLIDITRLRDTRWGGTLIGLACGIKLTPAFFVLYLLVCGRSRNAVQAAKVAAGTVAIATLFMPRPSWRYFTDAQFLFSLSETGKSANQSLLGGITRLTDGGGATRVVWWTAAAAVGIVGLWASSRIERRLGPIEGLVVAATTALIVAPTSWTHYWVWWIPAMLVVVRHTQPLGQWIAAAAGAAVSLPFFLGRWWFPPYPETARDRAHLGQIVLDDLYLLSGLVAVVIACVVAHRVREPPLSV